MTGLLLAAAFLASLLGSLGYMRWALARGIIAKVSSRGLHDRVVPRGGGVVFGAVAALATLGAWALGLTSAAPSLAVGLVGAAAVVVGFWDDVHEIAALKKLGLHAALAGLLVAVLYRPVLVAWLAPLETPWRITALLAIWFVPVWLINLYNFIDGADGMASFAAVFISGAALTVLLLLHRERGLSLVPALVCAACAGFLPANLPPARVFMGDAGSIFLGYVFAALALITVALGAMTAWTWAAILAYYLADTTTTFVCRLFLVRRWWGVHRSHAYQNLARVTRSHAKVTYGVALYDLLWALPLAIWSALDPARAPLAAGLALAPGVAWTLRYGPPFSAE